MYQDTIPSYTIKNMDGGDYIFIQWKSGDYTIRRSKPCYYVFKKTFADFPSAEEYLAEVSNYRLEESGSDNPYITINIDENGNIYDTMDYEFVIDTPLMWLNKGQIWELANNLDILDIIYNDTVTCYNGIVSGGCGECPACILRHKGYAEFLKMKGEINV